MTRDHFSNAKGNQRLTSLNHQNKRETEAETEKKYKIGRSQLLISLVKEIKKKHILFIFKKYYFALVYFKASSLIIFNTQKSTIPTDINLSWTSCTLLSMWKEGQKKTLYFPKTPVGTFHASRKQSLRYYKHFEVIVCSILVQMYYLAQIWYKMHKNLKIAMLLFQFSQIP